MVISHNMLALNANRQFNIINKNKAKSTVQITLKRNASSATAERLFHF